MKNLVIDPNTKEYLRHCDNDAVKLKLELLYNNKNIILTNSGLQSNYIALNTIINKYENINLLYGCQLYHESIELLKYFKNVTIYKLNHNILDLFKNELNNKNNVLFIESCSNPNGYIFDFDLIKEIRNLSLNLHVICDNTWLTSSIFNPFQYDIDIVTISLSKYYSGGNVICGACLFKNHDDYLIANNFIKITGVHITPLQIHIINDQINYLDERINHCSNLTYQTLEFLYPYKTLIINHPLLNTHESYSLRKKYFKHHLIPSVFTIGINIDKNKLSDILNELTIFKIETSFGSEQSKIDTYIYEFNIPHIRLSIGYNDNFDRIKSGLIELINLIQSVKDEL
jgi:cystathionine beta-lyase/cystathionine gamma-synthase